MLPLLFARTDIYSVLENQRRALREKVASAPESLAQQPDEEIVARFAREFEAEVPTLQEAEMFISEREVQMDVSHDVRRMFIRSGPFYVAGTEITVHIPFIGEAAFFDIQPSSFNLSPPRGKVEKGELSLQYEFANDMPPPNLKQAINGTLKEINSYLQHHRESAARLKQELEPIAREAWSRRKAEFVSKQDVMASLGIPRRSFPQTASISIQKKVLAAPKSPPRHTSGHRWKVFISHASEDKDEIARPLADSLIEAGVEVWYDDYALEIGDSLRTKIDQGLSQSEFGVVILSKAFFSKHWPRQELNGLASRESNGRKVILPVWHEISKEEILQASPILADRLGVPTSLGLRAY